MRVLEWSEMTLDSHESGPLTVELSSSALIVDPFSGGSIAKPPAWSLPLGQLAVADGPT